MPTITSYRLAPTPLIPNSPFPPLHYTGCLANPDVITVHDCFASNGWKTQWIFRYGPTQASHYHSAAHECMTGSATIHFGVADVEVDERRPSDGEESSRWLELQANTGDVFLIPAGVAHKTFEPRPKNSTFELLTPGEGHGMRLGVDPRQVLAGVKLSGFTMLGAYPTDSVWDFSEGGKHVRGFEKIWAVPRPEKDPIMGSGEQGLCVLGK